MQSIITREQIEEVVFLVAEHGRLSALSIKDLLQSLPVLEGDPVARQYFTKFKHGSGWTETPEFNAEILDTRELFTHPAPFTHITADDVTDEIIQVFNSDRLRRALDYEVIVAAVNAYLGAKK
jgi:hypothetical protein